MTIEEVKKHLPSVKLKIDGQVIEGKITGRKLPFAQIRWGVTGNVEASWELVTRCVNDDRPVIV